MTLSKIDMDKKGNARGSSCRNTNLTHQFHFKGFCHSHIYLRGGGIDPHNNFLFSLGKKSFSLLIQIRKFNLFQLITYACCKIEAGEKHVRE